MVATTLAIKAVVHQNLTTGSCEALQCRYHVQILFFNDVDASCEALQCRYHTQILFFNEVDAIQ